MKKSSKKALIISLSAIVFIIILAAVLGLYTKIISVKELGDAFLNVFKVNFTVKVLSRTISFLIVFAMFFISTIVVASLTKDKTGPLVNLLKKMSFKIIISLVVSVFASAYISETIYDTFLLFTNSTQFGMVDPLFGEDIGYYIFIRPFLAALINSLISVWLVVVGYCMLMYIVVFAVNEYYDLRNLIEDRPAIVHNLVNVVIFFILKALTYKFTSQEILYSDIGGANGAGYTDIYVWYNFYKVAPYLLMALVALSLVFFFRSQYKRLFMTVLVYPVAIIAVSVTAFAVQAFVVNPNESVKERPYLEYNLSFTKKAFKLDNVIEKQFAVDNNLTEEDITENKSVLDSIRITDFASTVTAYNSIQGIRDFYKFNDVDISKYNINGTPTLVMLSPREISGERLDKNTSNYTNRTFRYTHGFGAVMSPQNKVTAEGQPEFLIKDIPPESEKGVVKIKQPRVYYGETMTDYAIVNSAIKEIDYLEGNTDKEFSYDGKGGIKLSFLNRLIYSFKNLDFHMLISNYITPESKILVNRNVKKRVEEALPFLKFDNPNFVIDDNGYLKWIIDGYTTSKYYPYSQTYDGINYIRNSVKVIVDAYDGTVEAYITDKTDPIIQSYAKAYPGVFKTDALPDSISDHIVYPEYLFKLQATVYGKYHVSNATSFYNNSDSWVFSKEKYGSEIRDIKPYYNLLKINEFTNTDHNFVIMIPYTLREKENMTSYLAASCDYSNYGQMVVYKFPKGKNVYGTQQIESRIDNDPAISKEMTLWGQGGSTVIRGNMLVVPIKTSLLYIEPIYITSQSAAGLPELKRVIVSYGDRVVMEPTLSQAIDVIFKNAPPSIETGNLPPLNSESESNEQIVDDEVLNEIIERIIESYNNAGDSNKQGDWRGFGDNMTELDKAIKDLEKYKK